MCYHYALAASPAELAARYRKEKQEVGDYIKTYHISAFTHSGVPEDEPARSGNHPKGGMKRGTRLDAFILLVNCVRKET